MCVCWLFVCELSCACAVAAAFSSCFNHLNAAHCFRASPLNTVALYLQRCVLSSVTVSVYVCVFVSVPALINIIEHGMPEERFVFALIIRHMQRETARKLQSKLHC